MENITVRIMYEVYQTTREFSKHDRLRKILHTLGIYGGLGRTSSYHCLINGAYIRKHEYHRKLSEFAVDGMVKIYIAACKHNA